MVVFFVFPFYWLLTTALKTRVDAFSMPPKWIFTPVFENFAKVFTMGEFMSSYRNSIIVAVVTTLISLVVTVPCAYALAVDRLPGKKFISGLFLFTMFFGGGLIPLYLLVRDMGLLNTVWAVLLPSAGSIWNIIITRTFFRTTIPRELEEAAEIDGCSILKKFFRIILPLSTPIIAVMALFYGVGRWNSYFQEMIFLSDRNLFPLQVFLRELLVVTQMDTSSMSTSDAVSMAEQARIASIIKYAVMIVATLPVIAVYPFLQRYFVKGVMVGSIKG